MFTPAVILMGILAVVGLLMNVVMYLQLGWHQHLNQESRKLADELADLCERLNR